MRRYRIYILAIVFCLMANVSCIDRPASVLSEEDMIDLLVDVHRSEGLLDLNNGHADDEYQRAVMASVMVKHGVTREQYDSSLMWYAKHLKLFVRVYSHVEERLEEEHNLWNERMIAAREFSLSQEGDSVEVWTLPTHLVLDPRKLTATRFWEIEADRNYWTGDTLRWKFELTHLNRGQKLIASMVYRTNPKDYENAESNYRNRVVSIPVGSASILIEENGPQQLDLVPDTLMRFGSCVLNLTMITPDSIQTPAFLQNISLKRYHLHD